MKVVLLFLFLLVLNFSLYSQLLIDAEIRPRFEFNDGVKTLLNDDQAPAFVALQRTRLNLNYQDEKLSTRFSVQDARIWGESVYKSDASTINVFEAWVGYKVSQSFSFKLGRQSIKYDDFRLIGPSNWGNVGASHDLALFQFKQNSNTLHLGLAYNNDKDKKFESNYPLDYYKYLMYLWYNKEWNSVFKTSLMNIFDGYQKEGTDNTYYTRGTSGLFFQFGSDSVKPSLVSSIYYQYGKNIEGQPISAYFGSLALTYKWSKKFNTLIGIDYFSGEDVKSSDNKYTAFNNLYGDGHGYYGYMDYFTNIDEHTNGGGLTDLYLNFQYKISKKISGELALHKFWLSEILTDTITQPGMTIYPSKKLGMETDIVFNYKIEKNIELKAGYSFMLADKTMELLKKGDSEEYQQWAWVMITFKPVLFKSEK